MQIGRLRIDAGFVLLLSFLVFMDEGMLLWFVWVAALLHEAGHFFALRLAGGRVERVALHGGGITMCQAAIPQLGYRRELFAVAAGPAASLFCALLFSRMNGMIYGATALAGICLSHGIFNLLPAKGLDGGRALSLLLALRGTGHSGALLRATSLASMLFCAITGLWLFWQTGPAVLLACGLALISLARELGKPEHNLLL